MTTYNRLIVLLALWVLNPSPAFAHNNVVVVPLGSSAAKHDTIKVKDRNGATIGNFVQRLEFRETFILSDEGYFTVVGDTGNVAGLGSIGNIYIYYSGLNCTGIAYRDVGGLAKPLVFLARPTTSTNPADWKIFYTPRDAQISYQVNQSLSNMESGCIGNGMVEGFVYPAGANDPAVTGFEFTSGDFSYANPLIIE